MERKTVVIAQSDLERQKAVCEQIREYWLAQGRTPLAFVDTYGCQQNEADSERIRGMLQSCGYQLSDTEEGADCIVINTCAIREHAETRVYGNVGAEIRFDEQAQTPWFAYTDGESRAHEVWFEDARSSLAKYRLVTEYGLCGIGYWNFMRPFTAGFALLNAVFRLEP